MGNRKRAINQCKKIISNILIHKVKDLVSGFKVLAQNNEF